MPKQYLLIPGPTPVPQDVLLEMAKEMVNHRGSEFANVVKTNTEMLKKVFKTENDVLILTTSGTGGMESAVVNFFSPEDKVLVGVCGEFGERFARICRAYGLNVKTLNTELGKGIEPEALEKALKEDPDIKAVLLTHNETSTGVTNNLKELAPIVKEKEDRLLIVDAVSSLGAIDLPTDELKIDVVITASQKALETPPGLAMVSVSPLAWEFNSNAKLPRFYFDLKQAKKFLEDGATPFTPAVSIFFALRKSLENILSRGLENNFKRHMILGKAVRNGISSLGVLKLLADEKWASNTVTGVFPPDGVNPDDLRKFIRTKYGVVLTGGQGALKGKIFRIGHVGYVEPTDILVALSSLEIALEDMGFKGLKGKAVEAAEKIFAEN
ncbi:MAG TPA: alanine--glyoxylate aminotransferase family protein [Dictyoglomaceae bacterium]|nr:alanine--glyoxylate aminotransferase family protein [Dictyoglomaceae bacterium]HOL40168.1 alanine--glyoxylate aminotransferase family protein [Dictyoglomaceae bacterium]HPP16644.1 alanine--glyoxylate aminotransferase family protein [Dictyoglomaceae bacterium]